MFVDVMDGRWFVLYFGIAMAAACLPPGAVYCWRIWAYLAPANRCRVSSAIWHSLGVTTSSRVTSGSQTIFALALYLHCDATLPAFTVRARALCAYLRYAPRVSLRAHKRAARAQHQRAPRAKTAASAKQTGVDGGGIRGAGAIETWHQRRRNRWINNSIARQHLPGSRFCAMAPARRALCQVVFLSACAGHAAGCAASTPAPSLRATHWDIWAIIRRTGVLSWATEHRYVVTPLRDIGTRTRITLFAFAACIIVDNYGYSKREHARLERRGCANRACALAAYRRA